MGGDKTTLTNSVANGLHLCVRCHDTIERNRVWGQCFGYLIPTWPGGIDPALVPVFYRGAWMLLDNDGGVNPDPNAPADSSYGLGMIGSDYHVMLNEIDSQGAEIGEIGS